MDLEREFRRINQQYPWATDVLLVNLADQFADDIETKADTIKEISNSRSDVPNTIKNVFDRYRKYANIGMGYTKDLLQGVSSLGKDISRQTDPLASFADLTEKFGGAMTRSGANLSRYTKGWGEFFPAAGAAIQVGGKGFAMVGASMGVYGALIKEQEKSIRAMIDFGMVVSDRTLYTDMRGAFAYMGISLNEGLKNYTDMIPIFARLGNNTTETMGNFVARVGQRMQNESQPLQRFGRTREGVLRQMSNEASALTRYNVINELNDQSFQKVLNRYDESNKIFNGIAGLMGVSRQTFDQLKTEALDDNDFNAAMLLSQSAIIDRMGETGYEYLLKARQSISSTMNLAVGDDLTRLINDAMTRTIYDFRKDQDYQNNLGPELIAVLNLLGDESTEKFLDLMDTVFDPNSAMDLTVLERRKIDFINSLRNSGIGDARVLGNEILQNQGAVAIAREALDMSLLVSEEYTTISDAELKAYVEAQGPLTENADNAVEAVDQAAVAMRAIYDNLTPGFEIGGRAIRLFGDMIVGTRDAMVEVLTLAGAFDKSNEGFDIDLDSFTEDATNRESQATPVRSISKAQVRKIFEAYEVIHTPQAGDSPEMFTPAQNNAFKIDEFAFNEGGAYGISITGMNPIFTSEGGSTMLRDGATENIQRVLRGPFAKMQEYYGGAIPINDALAKKGSSRETETQNSQHFFGNALDLSLTGLSDAQRAKLVHSAYKAGFTGFGFGKNILHVDVGDRRAWDYGNALYAGVKVSEWKKFVRGEASGINPRALEELEPLQSDFTSLVPTPNSYKSERLAAEEAFALLDELDQNFDGVVDDSSRQQEYDDAILKLQEFNKKFNAPFTKISQTQEVEINPGDRDVEDRSFELLEKYRFYLKAIREQSEQFNYRMEDVDE